VYKLLTENYVEDDDNMFRFDYSQAFLQWALLPPHWTKDFHIGVRMSTGTKKLVGFITGIPQRMRVHQAQVQMVEINFLCVHKKLRSKRLAPVLIKEVTRRVNLTNVWQAVYTAGVVLPKPVSSTRYWHRSLQVKKLIDVHFTRLQKNMTMMRTIKLYKVNDQPLIPGIRQMTDADVPHVHRLLTDYLSKFSLVPLFTEEEVRHWLVPRPEVMYAYVAYNAKGKLTDFCSFYNLPSTIIGHAVHHSLKAAYSFYNVATGHTTAELMADALTFAYKEGFDVFNALDVMENATFLEKLKFGPGDGQLQYYLYNWRSAQPHTQHIHSATSRPDAHLPAAAVCLQLPGGEARASRAGAVVKRGRVRL
jgi:glycylpeptide N-tetradecanoyltransferase